MIRHDLLKVNDELKQLSKQITSSTNELKGQIEDLSTKSNFRIFDTVEDRDKVQNARNGELCFVSTDGVYYSYKNDTWEIFQSGSGGGGGSTIGVLTSTLDKKTLSIAVGEELIVDLFFSTPNVGAGTLCISSNGTELVNQPISMGSNKVPLSLMKGVHRLEIYAIDRSGIYTNTILIQVNCGGLEISTTFNSEKDYAVGTMITFPYTVDTISSDIITTYFKIGNDSYKTTSSKGYNTYVFPNLGAGSYNVEIYSKSGEFESNKLRFTLVMLDSGSLYVSSLFNTESVEEGTQVLIDYRVSMQKVKEFTVEYLIDDEFYKRGTAYNGANTFLINDLPAGSRKITIRVSTLDGLHTAQVDVFVEVIQSEYASQKPVMSGLLAWFDAYGLTNQDLDRGIWKDKSGHNYVGTLNNFNYNTNGWLNNGLKMNGKAYTTLNIQPFLNNAETGITIDVVFETEDVGNENARVLDCVTPLASSVGCYIDTNESVLKSNANTVRSPFAQNEKTRITYVIDRLNRVSKMYVNAVMCEAAFLTDMGSGNDEILEDFKHSEYIYLNSQKGETQFGDCTVYSVRIYGRPLNSEEVLQNHIADIKDKHEQKKKYDFNYNNTIPTMYFYGDTTAMTKENRVPLRIKYISTDDKMYGSSFDLDGCEVQWQGTSSLQYVIKNYKIRLKGPDGKKFKHSLREGMIPESKFCLKADYMESSHANNTGAAKIVNRYLYTGKLPPQELNSAVVSAIDGFPIKLYINDELLGVFNFNLDKGCEDSFGLDLDLFPNCVSYEVTANTDTTAGAFNKWTQSTGLTELKYLQNDFELRFPDEKDVGLDYGYMDKLKRLVDWVSDASDEKFKTEFDQYLNKEYTLKYYIFVLVFGMVDNLGKNMMINTWDGEIWYPCFYDLDTCLALDNSGYVRFDVDIEMVAGTYNTSASKLWSKVGRVFADEITAMYKQMRGTIFKESNILKVLMDEQINQIPELLYNLDSQQKYLNFGKSYIHMLHGNRKEHMKKWINERLLYLDSKLGYEENTKESITIRANKQGWVNLDIKTYSPMYIKVVWRNGAEQIEKVGRNQTKRFSYNLPTATDQEIFIYAAKHLKEIGDISHMTPTSLSLTNASRLTKLVCTNNNKLQALGMGGEVNGVSYNLKNLQLLDLTNCSQLGKASGNNGLDVSKCDNLKTLKVQGTALQNVTFNPKGGNLEEIYMNNDATSLYLANQYNLTKVIFNINGISHREVKDSGTKITNLTITNCPNLKELGLDKNHRGIALTDKYNYLGQIISQQDDSFDISKDDYLKGFMLCAFGSLERVVITNSLLEHKYFMTNFSPSLMTLQFNDMPNLKGVIFAGNRTYGPTGGSVNDNKEGIPMFENIQITRCENFDTIIFQNSWSWANRAFKFKENFEWDLSHLPLKRFICNMGLQNLKKIILPRTIKEFSHSQTVLIGYDQYASDGSMCKYTKEMSPLETIVIDGHYEEGFSGIDLGGIPLKNVSLNGLLQKVNVIKNVNCVATDVNPRIVPGNVEGQTIENIKINLNNYKGSSLFGLFKNTDVSKITVTLDNSINTENIDYSEMFYNAKNVLWENIKWLKKLPKGTFYKTFTNCDVDRIEVGNMIGETTVNMESCFQNMPNVIEIDLTGANTDNVTSFKYCFQDSKKLERLIGAENLIKEKCGSIVQMFYNTYKLKFSFPNNKPNWKLKEGKFQETGNWLLQCGKDVVLGENETNILDLREFGVLSGNYYNGFSNEQYMGFTHFYADGWDYTGTGVTSHSGKPNYSHNPNLVELHLTNFKIEASSGGFVRNNPKLETLNLEGTDASKMSITATNWTFADNPKLRHVKFLKNMSHSFDVSASTLLTVESLLSILNGLSDLTGTSTGGSTKKGVAKLGQANLDKLTPEQKKIAIDKNWTLTV